MRQESLKPSKDLFVELRHMYCDFGGVEFLEGEMRAILETIAPELEEMEEMDGEELMREIRSAYGKADSVLKSFISAPEKDHLNWSVESNCDRDDKMG